MNAKLRQLCPDQRDAERKGSRGYATSSSRHHPGRGFGFERNGVDLHDFDLNKKAASRTGERHVADG